MLVWAHKEDGTTRGNQTNNGDKAEADPKED